jgi:hypothetical protein
MAVSAIFWTGRSWAADDLARSRGVQKIMGYSKSSLVMVVTASEAGSVVRYSGGRYGSSGQALASTTTITRACPAPLCPPTESLAAFLRMTLLLIQPLLHLLKVQLVCVRK